MALKVFDRWGDNWDGTDDSKFYLKSEADREIRRQKRKRCLAMARIASDDFHLHNSFYAMGKRDFELRAMNRCEKHRAKWLELADKLKE